MAKKKARSRARVKSSLKSGVKSAKQGKQVPSDNSNGVASLVLGILSIIFSMVPLLGLILGILGIVFASKQKKIASSGAATGGMITSIIGLVFSILWTCAVVMMILYLIPAAVYYK